VPVLGAFDCSGSISDEHFAKMLDSTSLSDRYVAAKALGHFPSDMTTRVLARTVADDNEHIYVRLESAASMFRLGHREYISFFNAMLGDHYLENRLECAIVLGEIPSDKSRDLLIHTLLDQSQHPEIRAGAAWSLGELQDKDAMGPLIKVFNNVEEKVRVEAARALLRFSAGYQKEIVGLIPQGSEDERAGIAWALSNSGGFAVRDLLPSMTDDEARRWISWIIGTQDQAAYVGQIEELKHADSEVYFAVTVLWKILASWVAGLDVYYT